MIYTTKSLPWSRELVSWIPFVINAGGSVLFLDSLVRFEMYEGGMVHNTVEYLNALVALAIGVFFSLILYAHNTETRRMIEKYGFKSLALLSLYGAVPISLEIGMGVMIPDGAIGFMYLMSIICTLFGCMYVLVNGMDTDEQAGAYFMRTVLVVAATIATILTCAGILEQGTPNHLSPDSGEAFLLGVALLFMVILLPLGGIHMARLIAHESKGGKSSVVMNALFLIACIVPVVMYATERAFYLGWLPWHSIPLAASGAIMALSCADWAWRKWKRMV